ncbi:MAG: tyrosine phosphatase family protein [Alphaproteobacteria bacterium]
MIYVTSLAMLDRTMRSIQPSRLVTLLPADEYVETPEGLPGEHHLRLGMHDITEVIPGMTAPGPSHVEELIAFIRNWDDAVRRGEAEPRIVFHCRMRISRSGAAAYIALCMLSEAGQEADIAQAMRALGAHIQPNQLIVQIADELLGREGRMAEAIDALGPGSGLNLMDWLELTPPR